jgi:hypothetical protein
MPTVAQAPSAVRPEHRYYGDLVGNVREPTPSGYRLCATGSCGARWERWVTEAHAVEDLVRSELLLRES